MHGIRGLENPGFGMWCETHVKNGVSTLTATFAKSNIFQLPIYFTFPQDEC